MASGIRMRVKRNSPVAVAKPTPAKTPASRPMPQRANRYVTQQSRIARQRQRQPRRPVVHAEDAERAAIIQ